uniref:HECT-type E3 ubiquitin transferase n=1 Tax=Panagrolaimus sp. JU765 TaxID=591449 RepID=A0AC34QH10_9BILA
MFEVDEKNPLNYLDYKSNGVCGAATGSVEWQISPDLINDSVMRKQLYFRYFDGLTGNMRASSDNLLVYTDAVLSIDSITCKNLPKSKNGSFYVKVQCGENSRYKTTLSTTCVWSDLNFIFNADRSREIQFIVKEKNWRSNQVVGEANIAVADLVFKKNQEFASVLWQHNSEKKNYNLQIHIACHFVPQYKESVSETMKNLLSSELIKEKQQTSMCESRSDSSAISSSMITDTSSLLSDPINGLPPGWEARVDGSGRILYLDHKNKTTSWKPPTILEPDSDDQNDIFNSNVRYLNSRRTVTANVDKNGNQFSRPINLLCSPNFLNLLRDNPESLKTYNESIYLKHIIHKIRKNPDVFLKYSQHKELVDFLNSFADKTQPLPNGWQIARRQQMDQRLYIDHYSRQITLIDPRLPVDTKIRTRSAPPQRRKHDSNGNTLTEIVERTDEIANMVKLRFPEIAPRICQKLNVIKHHGPNALLRFANDVDVITAISVLDDTVAPTPKTAFEEKVHYFYQSLQRAGHGQGPGKIKFKLRRSHLMNDAYDKILSVDAVHLKKYHMSVNFAEEEGLDYGGPSRELFFLLSRELFNPYYGLFECSTDNYTVQVSAMSKFVENSCQWMELCGRVLGLALIHRCMIDTFFTRPFYKMLLGEPYKLEDLQLMDLQYYNSLLWIRNNKITSDLELTFNTSEEIAGEIVEQELLPGGKQIKVTEGNKEEFISLMIRWRVEKNAEAQNKAILRGLYSLIDREYLRVFDAEQLELVLSGTVEINIEDWRANTEYKGGYSDGHVVVRWFWKTVHSFSNADRLKLLQFVTGTSSVPFEGFKALRGSDGFKKFTIEKYGNETYLPRAHTCFNRLDLPPYPTQQTLLTKLQIAISESSSYAIE